MRPGQVGLAVLELHINPGPSHLGTQSEPQLSDLCSRKITLASWRWPIAMTVTTGWLQPALFLSNVPRPSSHGPKLTGVKLQTYGAAINSYSTFLLEDKQILIKYLILTLQNTSINTLFCLACSKAENHKLN